MVSLNPNPANGVHATVMIVEDDAFVRESLCEVVQAAGHATINARDGKEAIDRLAKQPVDLLLLDLELPRVHGMDVLRQAVDAHPDMPVVILTGKGTISMAVEATRLGAYDFLEKPPDLGRILVTVRNALEKSRLQRQRDLLLNETSERYRMVGTSETMQQIYRLIDRAAATLSRVLIRGEHGTGKELVARAIHMNSDRSAEPFVAVNCAAIPETLIESELFGYEKGAFTDATDAHPGKFEQAQGGTLFLDEIGDMSLMTQAKVLRALGESTIERLGGIRTIPVDVRIIAATNKDLEQEMKQDNFREDLYYRLDIIAITIPPLRHHREDIPDLMTYYLDYFVRTMDRVPKILAPNALTVLMEYDWPGNVRELRYLVERLMVLSESETIRARDVETALNNSVHQAAHPSSSSLREARERFEHAFILQTLNTHDWKIQNTAKTLGIERTHLWKKMKQYGIKQG